MIESLLQGKETSSFVVIKDCLTALGENLLICRTRQLSAKGDVIVALDCGTGYPRGYETFAVDCLEELQCNSDPSPLSSTLQRIQSHPLFPASDSSSSTTSSSSRSSVVFLLPDLNSLFLFFPSSSVFRFFDSLLRLQSSSSIIGLLHRDCFPASLLPSLDYLTRTSITLHPAPSQLTSSSSLSSSSTQNPFSYLADVFHKKPSGKVIRSRQLVNLASSPPRLVSAVDVAKLTVKDDPTPCVNSDVAPQSKPPTATNKPQIAYEDSSSSSSSSSDPTANLTFNLNLSDKEKVAREKVVLPFAKKAATGQGRIIYQAEDEDDLDEEDPDDDLNI